MPSPDESRVHSSLAPPPIGRRTTRQTASLLMLILILFLTSRRVVRFRHRAGIVFASFCSARVAVVPWVRYRLVECLFVALSSCRWGSTDSNPLRRFSHEPSTGRRQGPLRREARLVDRQPRGLSHQGRWDRRALRPAGGDPEVDRHTRGCCRLARIARAILQRRREAQGLNPPPSTATARAFSPGPCRPRSSHSPVARCRQHPLDELAVNGDSHIWSVVVLGHRPEQVLASRRRKWRRLEMHRHDGVAAAAVEPAEDRMHGEHLGRPVDRHDWAPRRDSSCRWICSSSAKGSSSSVR